MTLTETDYSFDLAAKVGRASDEESFAFACLGYFNHKLTDSILYLTERNLQNLDSNKIAKKVYYMLVEGLQNITRHQDNAHMDNDHAGFFIIQRKCDAYSITYGNLIDLEAKNNLEGKLSDIQQRSPQELKAYYLEILDKAGFSEKGGAGLGLIDMARKSSSRLTYRFEPMDEKEFYYYLNLTIAIDPEKNEYIERNDLMDEAVDMHRMMRESNTRLLFKGLLDQDNVSHLASNIESTIQQDPEDADLVEIMKELLENVVKHAYSRYSETSVPAVFMLTQGKKQYTLLTGNFVHAEKLAHLRARLETLNGMGDADIEKYSADETDNGSAGQGFIELRKISGEPFVYQIKEANGTPAYFMICLKVNKK